MGDLTTLANVRQYLKFQSQTQSTDDPVLERMITQISAFIQTYISRNILSASYTDALDGHSTRRIAFNNYPVTAVASVAVDGVSISPAAGPPWANGYVFNDRFLSLFGYCFTSGYGNVQLAYTAGFSTVPGDLENAVIEAIAFRYREIGRIGQKSASLNGAETASWNIADFPPQTKTLLSNYKRVHPLS